MTVPDPTYGEVPSEWHRLNFQEIETRLTALEAGGSGGELTLSATPDYTCTVTTTDDTSIWKGINVPGWGRFWFLTSTAFAGDVDTSGALDDAGIPGSELSIGDLFLCKTATGGGLVVTQHTLKGFTDGTPATNIDLSSGTSLGLANVD